MSSGPPNTNDPRKSSKTVSLLTKLAHGSAPFLTTFVLIHLSAPVLANIGGSNLSSQVMLLGREYYQTGFGEKYLLFAPLGIHVVSSISKRLSLPRNRPRKLSSLLSITAYSTLLVLLPIHFFTHRIAPTDSSGPIFAVGPAELDYEFVKVGLAKFPWRSWALYTGLVGCVALHASEGFNIIRSTWLSGVSGPSAKTRRIIAGLSVLPVLSGLYMVSKEPLMTFSSIAARFDAVYARSLVYRL
ncbi:hypothetical protein BJ138DRAFT_1179218 [Hygrophoropsis aurantiaca]|uniref:Uncharacterized protein n=1 Tax=Hygrophoropsis aurantiaca TaxID=72124 RepID=A0ACB8AF90_9AGAM|nr:hypothetical protein BJ138DRAFT_1179218 [Hygrophoropsis aurantiaca]